MILAQPLALLLVVLLPICWWRGPWERWSRPAYWIWMPARYLPILQPNSWRQRLLWIPLVLELLGLLFWILALARPQTLEPHPRPYLPRLALFWVIDVSGSMGEPAQPFSATNPTQSTSDPNATQTTAPTRLELLQDRLLAILEPQPSSTASSTAQSAWQHEAELAASGTEGLAWMGLVAFARTARLVCPLTNRQTLLRERLAALKVDRFDNRTNLGDALALAMTKLEAQPAPHRWLILCTDGIHNVREGIEPGEAAQLAAALGIQIWTIDAASVTPTSAPNEPITIVPDKPTQPDPSLPTAAELQQARQQTLQRLAELTGGTALSLAHLDQLAAALSKLRIDPQTLPTTLIIYKPVDHFRICLLVGMILVVLALGMRRTWFAITPD